MKFLIPLLLIAGAALGAPKKDAEFQKVSDAYAIEFLKRNPMVNTYLGGSGLNPELIPVDGKFRDASPEAIRNEDEWLTQTQKKFEEFKPTSLSSAHQIDREVALAQIRFQLHLHQVRKYQERALDTYIDEPFRAIDFQLQGMGATGEKTYGTQDEWALVELRLKNIPAYLETAKKQILAGVASGNTPDFRMITRNGLESTAANANYFEKTLPDLAKERVSGEKKENRVDAIALNGKAAAQAYREFRAFIANTFLQDPTLKSIAVKPAFSGDRFILGEVEYNWALKNNLKVTSSAGALFDASWPIVQATRKEMVQLAREIGKSKGLSLPKDEDGAVRTVFEKIAKEHPQNDVEMVEWYRKKGIDLVAYARTTGLFDVPAHYQLEVVETPPPLQASIDGAAYYPAPPFRNQGVGHFYVTTTGNNPDALKEVARASLADLAAHEGFPGHDWHYKVMTQYRNEIAPVRWLTPGSVEDSSSMWEDSMAAEGWALYSEALLTEGQKGAPQGFYSPEERLYQLQGKLYRDLRVRVDTGIHTKRLSYDEAVRLFSETVDFQPGDCTASALSTASPAKKVSCGGAEKALYRYSKWPTQAITYRLGKDEIFSLREAGTKLLGKKFSPKTFHLEFMKQGTIPATYFKSALLERLKRLK